MSTHRRDSSEDNSQSASNGLRRGLWGWLGLVVVVGGIAAAYAMSGRDEPPSDQPAVGAGSNFDPYRGRAVGTGASAAKRPASDDQSDEAPSSQPAPTFEASTHHEADRKDDGPAESAHPPAPHSGDVAEKTSPTTRAGGRQPPADNRPSGRSVQNRAARERPHLEVKRPKIDRVNIRKFKRIRPRLHLERTGTKRSSASGEVGR